jgi:hypothetical protein
LEYTKQISNSGRLFDEEKVFYDMLKRNSFIFPKAKKTIKKESEQDIQGIITNLKEQVQHLSHDLFIDDEQLLIMKKLDLGKYKEVIDLIEDITPRIFKENTLSASVLEDISKETQKVMNRRENDKTT